jgi:DNA-binding NarL/FixJ family response regulator
MDILIADDSTLVREHILNRLDGVPYVGLKLQASNAYEAYEMIDEYEPDVVIVDIHMPGNGLELVKKIRSSRVMPRAVIMLTNYATKQYRKAAKSLGVDYFFDKTAEFEEAFALLRSLSIQFSDS